MRRSICLVLLAFSAACGGRTKDVRVAAKEATPSATPTPAVVFVVPSPEPEPTLGIVYRIGDDVTAPELLTMGKGKRTIPDPCKGHRVQGIGILAAVVDEMGRVRHVRATRPPVFDPPCPAFEAYERAVLSEWRYKPAMRNGKAVPIYITFTVHSILE
jgi:hypothetical protein